MTSILPYTAQRKRLKTSNRFEDMDLSPTVLSNRLMVEVSLILPSAPHSENSQLLRPSVWVSACPTLLEPFATVSRHKSPPSSSKMQRTATLSTFSPLHLPQRAHSERSLARAWVGFTSPTMSATRSFANLTDTHMRLPLLLHHSLALPLNPHHKPVLLRRPRVCSSPTDSMVHVS